MPKNRFDEGTEKLKKLKKSFPGQTIVIDRATLKLLAHNKDPIKIKKRLAELSRTPWIGGLLLDGGEYCRQLVRESKTILKQKRLTKIPEGKMLCIRKTPVSH
jgi:hypothetical protein